MGKITAFTDMKCAETADASMKRREFAISVPVSSSVTLAAGMASRPSFTVGSEDTKGTEYNATYINSFIRPSDLKTLKHKHVEIVRNANVYLRLTLPATKSHNKPIVTLQPAVRVYRALTKHHHLKDNATPNDYLFLPQHKDRAYAARVLACYFNCVMGETSPKHGAQGQPRSLYSLRHSSITFRLLYGDGIDVLTLARNACTSVDMINRHYASTLTAEQNIGVLQSRRPQGR